MGIQLQEISCVRVVGHATWCVPCGKQGACREGGGGEDIGVRVTVITRCMIISSRSYSGLVVLSHPFGWIDHRYMNDMNWVVGGIIWIGVFGEMEMLVG